MTDQWASTADHAADTSGGWASTTDHAASPEDDLIRSYGYDPAVIKKAHMYSPDTFTKMMANPTEGILAEPGVMSDVIHGFNKAPLALIQLASHGAAKITGNPADAQFADLLVKVSNDAYRKFRGDDTSKVAEMAGQLLVPVPGGAARTIPGMIGRGALAGMVASGAQPVDVSGPQGDYWTPKAVQTGVGAALGGTTGGALGTGARLLSSRSVELPEETAAKVQAQADAAQAAADAAKKQAQAGGGSAVTALEAKMQLAPFAGANDVAKAAAAGDRSAIDLQARMDAASTPAQIQQASIGLQNWRTAREANRLYNVERQTWRQNQSLGDVDLTNTEGAITAALKDLQSAKAPDVALINELKTYQRNIGASADPRASDILVDNSYPAIRQMNRDLGETIAGMRTSAGKQLIGPSSANYLQRVKNAVNDDLRAYTAQDPALQKAADAADDYYARQRVPFTAADIAKAGRPDLGGSTTSAEADQIFSKFVQAGRGDKAQRFFDALDPRGRASVQYQMAADAMNKATDQATGVFDVRKFFNALDNSKDAYGVFFTGPDKALMDGLKNLAQQSLVGTERAEALTGAAKDIATTGAAKEAERLKTVSNVSKVLGGTSAVGAGLSAALQGAHGVTLPLSGAAGVLFGLQQLMTTPTGRRILADASNLTPGSPALAHLLDRVYAQTAAAPVRAIDQQ